MSVPMGRDPEDLRLAKQRRDECVNEAILTGLGHGVEAGAVSSTCVYLMHKYSDAFRTKFPASAKASFVVSAHGQPPIMPFEGVGVGDQLCVHSLSLSGWTPQQWSGALCNNMVVWLWQLSVAKVRRKVEECWLD